MKKDNFYNTPVKTFLLVITYFLIVAFNPNISYAQADLSFDPLTVHNDEFNKKTNSIVQDKYGFIWMGCQDGLYKYDGYSLRYYGAVPGDSSSLQSDEIYKLYVDKKDNLWIGTMGGGLSKYNYNEDNFITYMNTGDVNSLGFNDINTLTEDRDGNIWIGFRRGGLDRFDPESGKFFHYRHDEQDTNSLSSNDIISLHADKNNFLWIGTWESGLSRINLNEEESSFRHYVFKEKGRNNVTNNRILDIFEDSGKKIWIVKGNGSIGVYHKKSDNFEFVISNQNFPDISFEGVRDLAEVEPGKFWISTNNGIHVINNPLEKNSLKLKTYKVNQDRIPGELFIASPNIFIDKDNHIWLYSYGVSLVRKLKFQHFQLIPDLYNSNLKNNIVDIILSPENNIWLATWGQGLWYFNPELRTYNPVESMNFPGQRIRSLFKGSNGEYFICLQDNGFYLYNHYEKSLKHYVDYHIPRYRQYHNNITSVLEEKPGLFWLATGKGIIRFNSKTEEFTFLGNNINSNDHISNNFYTNIIRDTKGRFWLGTLQGGLYKAEIKDTDELEYIIYDHDPDQPGSISGNAISCIFEDSRNTLWIGTETHGLNKMTERGDSISFVTYNESNGFKSNYIHSILEDNNGFLWISTGEGLCRFKPKTKELYHYTDNDGLQSKDFSPTSSLKLNNGAMLFGGKNGFNYFHPTEIPIDTSKSSVLITGFKIYNEYIRPGEKNKNGKVILPKHISLMEELTLSYLDNSFSLEFSTLNFALPEQVSYSYKLEGYDDTWQFTGEGEHLASYTKVPHGNYLFKVRSTNTDEIWNEEPTVLTINITPPLWKSKGAVFFYIILLAFFVLMVRRVTYLRTNMKNNLVFERIMRDKDNENNRAKLQFFTNISHEFRTPLTLIIAPVEKLLNEIKEPSHVLQLNTIYLSTKRLLNLINQLMDFRKIDSGKMKARYCKTDLVKFLHEIHNSFVLLAEQNKINYYFESDFESETVYIDRNKLDKIIYNLLGNAFKATGSGDTITLHVKKVPSEKIPDKIAINRNKYLHFFQISISDTGEGIPEEQRYKIFERFYQLDQQKYTGTGIGLALVKELVDILNGGIEVKSKKDEGTIFLIYLPVLHDISSSENDIIPLEDDHKKYDLPSVSLESRVSYKDTGKTKVNEGDKKKILIVEDNFDLRRYLQSNLMDCYKIIEAENGKVGYEYCNKEYPDLIISDIMMPEMDGIELCRNVKTSLNTCHVPVILLTALSSVEDMITGHETGADAYISKPFNLKYLRAVIKNLIESREKMKEKFSNDLSIFSKNAGYTTRDQDFLNKATEIVKDNIENSAFDIDDFANHFSLSRSHLFRKIKAITNQSPTEFIRTIRLKMAARLLAINKENVSEVAYKTGFTSPSYFTHRFKKQFGISPKEYIEKSIKNHGTFDNKET